MNGFSSIALGGSVAPLKARVWILASGSVKEYKSVVLSHQDGDSLLQQPQKTSVQALQNTGTILRIYEAITL